MNTPKRFSELDALRGIAALLVVLFHYSMNYRDLPVFSIFRYGVTGVDLFFLISGFVIFQSIKAAGSGTEFLVNRLTRLYPTYWVAVSFTFFIIYLTNRVTGSDYPLEWNVYWSNMSMFQLYIGTKDLDGPYWTMIIEMVFYLVMFLLLITRLIQFTVPVFILLTATSLVVVKYVETGGECYWDYVLNFPLSMYVPLFFSGILFYKITAENERKWRFYLLIVACWFSQVLLFYYGGRGSTYIPRIHYLVLLTGYYGLFFLLAFQKLKWIINPVTLYLGKISFPLYLIHQFFSINFIIDPLTKKGISYYVAAYLIALPACILIASLISFTVEQKVSPFLRKWLKQLLLDRLPRFLKKKKSYHQLRVLLNRF